MSFALQTISEDEFQAFQHLIYTETGIALNDSKRCLLSSRLAKRLRALQLNDYLEYYEYILRRDADGTEMQEMINCITTNKTDFLREPHHFEFLSARLFPAIARKAATGGPRKVRIWCAASSHGHEPYSLAMTVREFAPFETSWDVRILASDIDTNVLSRAAEGVFDVEDLAPVGDLRMRRYFDRGTGSYAGKVRGEAAVARTVNISANQPHRGRLADPSEVRRHFLSQRHDLLRFADATESRRASRAVSQAGRLFDARPFGKHPVESQPGAAVGQHDFSTR